MTHHANGPFEVTMTPAGASEREGRTAFGRMQLDKQYTGDLQLVGRIVERARIGAAPVGS